MAEAQGTTESATQDKKGGAPVIQDNESWLSKPEELGNKAGQVIEDSLNPAGNVVGTGLSSVLKPVGNVVDGVVGGVIRSGNAMGQTVGVSGDKGDQSVESQEREGKGGREGIGGKEQNGSNPLGL